MPLNKLNLFEKRCIIFDCDGVILNSNSIKSNAFESLCSNYCNDIKYKFIQYHNENNGLSRFEKIKYLYTLIKDYDPATSLCEVNLIQNYSSLIKEKLKVCDVMPNLLRLRAACNNVPWYVVSAAYEKELIEVFDFKKII